MNSQILRPGSIAAGAVVIGGTLVMLLPQHAMSIVRLVIVTVAAAAALNAFGVHAPPRWWRSPFDRTPGGEDTGTGSRDIDRIRSEFSGRRRRIPNGPPLPPEVLHLLRPLVEVAVARAGLDPDDSRVAGRRRLSPLCRAVLAADRSTRPPWYRMVRPDRREVAGAAHRILDELDRLAAGTAGGHDTDSRHPRTT
jgi:hypothetical protein